MIKVFKVEPELTDSTPYFDFDGWDDFIIDGNRDFISFHTDYKLYDLIKEYCIDYDELLYAMDDPDNNSSGIYKNATEAIQDMLDFKPTTKQVHQIKEILEKPEDHSVYNYYTDDERIAELLTVCEKREWTTATIRGCCQRDYQTIFYPTDQYSKDFIEYIESLYFNTGTEVAICGTESEDEDFDDPGDYSDTYYNYYSYDASWTDEELKKHIAQDTGADPADISIYEPEEVRTIIYNLAS